MCRVYPRSIELPLTKPTSNPEILSSFSIFFEGIVYSQEAFTSVGKLLTLRSVQRRINISHDKKCSEWKRENSCLIIICVDSFAFCLLLLDLVVFKNKYYDAFHGFVCQLFLWNLAEKLIEPTHTRPSTAGFPFNKWNMLENTRKDEKIRENKLQPCRKQIGANNGK